MLKDRRHRDLAEESLLDLARLDRPVAPLRYLHRDAPPQPLIACPEDSPKSSPSVQLQVAQRLCDRRGPGRLRNRGGSLLADFGNFRLMEIIPLPQGLDPPLHLG